MRSVKYVELREADIKKLMSKCFDTSEDDVDIIIYTDEMDGGTLGNVVKIRVTTEDTVSEIKN